MLKNQRLRKTAEVYGYGIFDGQYCGSSEVIDGKGSELVDFAIHKVGRERVLARQAGPALSSSFCQTPRGLCALTVAAGILTNGHRQIAPL